MKGRANKRDQDQELEALVQLRDEDIDTSDIPEVKDWSKAVVGKFYRPLKEPVTLRLDVDVLAWVKSEGPGYQTRINLLLREAMTAISHTAGFPGREEARHSTRSAGLACRDFRFPGLERHGKLRKYDDLAELIEKRGSVFASTP